MEEDRPDRYMVDVNRNLLRACADYSPSKSLRYIPGTAMAEVSRGQPWITKAAHSWQVRRPRLSAFWNLENPLP